MIQLAKQAGTSIESQRASHGARSFGIGAVLLATCFCSIDRIAFGAAGASMLGTRFGLNLYSGIFVAAVALILAGLALRARHARFPALTGAILLAGGLVLAPPSAMHGVEPSLANMAGYGAMLLGAAAVVWAALRAFPTRKPGAAACAAGGFGAAAGCSCCVSSGAIAGFAVAAGLTLPAPPFADGIPYVAFTAVALGGLWWLAGPRWALVALAGALLAFGGDEGLKPLLADDVELLPRLVVTLAGTGLVIWAFARAFESMRPEPPAMAEVTGSTRPAPAGGGVAQPVI